MKVDGVFAIQKVYTAFEIFVFSMMFPFLIRHFSASELFSGLLVLFLVPLPIIFFAKSIETKKFMMFAFLARIAGSFIFFTNPTLPLLYLYYFLNGLVIFFFWIPYNTRYFIFSHKMNRATSAGNFIIIGPVLSTFIPLISALLITNTGYLAVVGIGLMMIAYLLLKTSKLPEMEISYSFWDMAEKAKGMRLLKFLQGMWEVGGMILIPFYTLNFVQGELGFGGFLSYLGIVGIIATVFVTKFSDKEKKRLKFYVPIITLLAISTASLVFADTLVSWAIANAFVGIFTLLAYPFFFAILLDKIKDRKIGMIAREFFLNAGRAFCMILVLALLYLKLPVTYGFIITAGCLALYVTIILTRKVYVEESYYPLSPVLKVYDSSKELVFAVYSWGKVEVFKKTTDLVTASIFTGVRWIDISLKTMSDATIKKLIKGDIHFILQKPKFHELNHNHIKKK